MLPITTQDLAHRINATLLQGPQHTSITGVAIDSRKVHRGDLFIAFSGEKVDGHDYIAQAVSNGAQAVLVSKPVQSLPENISVLHADDPLRAIQTLAQSERALFQGPVIAVTGSNGKTTTKEMLRAVFAANGPCLATEKNQNNELGLPLTLLKRESVHTSIVVEMGMRARGEIRDLCEIAQPTTGIITNIGHSHLELLGSQEQIALAKTELLEALPQNGLAILHGNDAWLRKLVTKANCKVLWFGLSDDCQAYATDVHQHGFSTEFTAHVLAETVHVVLPTLGTHNVLNALAALLAGAANGLSLKKIVNGLAGMTSESGRLHVISGKNERTIIDDCYNASPSSMKASLQVLTTMAEGRPTAAVLGDMYELGEFEVQGHREVGGMAVTLGVDTVLCVGALASNIASGAKATAGPASEKPVLHHFETKDELLKNLNEYLPDKAVVLVKASRGMQLEDIVSELAADRTTEL